MKKALVYTKAQEGKTVGEVAMKMEASELDKWTHHHLQFAEKIEVPVELEDLPENQLKGVLIPFQAEFWSDGVNTVYAQADVPLVDDGQGGQIPDPSYVYQAEIPEHWEIQTGDSYVAYDKSVRISERYELMNSEVLASMLSVFGTNNPESASAYYQTWQSMIAAPSSYSSAGLTARFTVGSVSVGDALDTDAKVTEYASGKKAEADAYGVQRMQRIEQFRTEKAAIEAE